MRIWGVLEKDADCLDPEQWVNVYKLTNPGQEFKCFCQVKDLPASRFPLLLQPTDARGNSIDPSDALIEALWAEAQRELGE